MSTIYKPKLKSFSAPTYVPYIEDPFGEKALENAVNADPLKTITANKIQMDVNTKMGKALSEKTIPTGDKVAGGTDLTTAANVLTGINTAVNAATSIYGAIKASKMKPHLMSYKAVVDPTLVSDQTSAIKAAGEENIDKSINSSRALDRRLGLSERTGVYLGKETEALNQLGGQLAQYRQGIDTQNAQIENNFKQFNKQIDVNTDSANTQIENNFDMQKSSIMGAGLSNAANSITQGTQSIVDNLNYKQVREEAAIRNEIGQIQSRYDSTSDITAKAKLRIDLENAYKKYQSFYPNLKQ